MAGNTFIQVPPNLDDKVALKRFLEKLVLQVDSIFSKRGQSTSDETTLGFVETVILNTKINKALDIGKNYLVSVDASSNIVNISLPRANLSLGNTISITKVDSSSNMVILKSNSNIGGESSFDLLLEQESLTLFSNGTEWIVS